MRKELFAVCPFYFKQFTSVLRSSSLIFVIWDLPPHFAGPSCDVAGPLFSTSQIVSSQKTPGLHTIATQHNLTPNRFQSASFLDETNVETSRQKKKSDDKHETCPAERFVRKLVKKGWGVNALIVLTPKNERKCYGVFLQLGCRFSKDSKDSFMQMMRQLRLSKYATVLPVHETI